MSNNKNLEPKKEKKVYRDGLGEIKNPANSLFGKIMIWILAFLMFGSILITCVWLVIQAINS